MRWEELKPHGFLPDTRYVHSATVMNDFMVLFGGEHFKKNQEEKKDHKLNDIWAYSPHTNRWTQVAPKECSVSGALKSFQTNGCKICVRAQPLLK